MERNSYKTGGYNTRNTEFFSNDKILEGIEKHRNKLKEKLKGLSLSLGISMQSEYHSLDWVKEVEIISPSRIIISNMIKNHLQVDNPDLLAEILSFEKKIENHKQNFNNYERVLDVIIKNKFIEKGILPSKDPEFGFYFNNDYIHLLNQQLMSILGHIKKSKDLYGLKNKQDFAFKREENGYFKVGYYMVGRCDESKVNDMIELIKNIPFEGIIMSELIDLYKSVSDLKKESEDIQNKIGDITQLIEDDQYKTLTSCCPTKDLTHVP